MVNGSPHDFPYSSMGLKQGGSVLPYLFVITMKAFNLLIEHAVEGRYLTVCIVVGRGRGRGREG